MPSPESTPLLYTRRCNTKDISAKKTCCDGCVDNPQIIPELPKYLAHAVVQQNSPWPWQYRLKGMQECIKRVIEIVCLKLR